MQLALFGRQQRQNCIGLFEPTTQPRCFSLVKRNTVPTMFKFSMRRSNPKVGMEVIWMISLASDLSISIYPPCHPLVLVSYPQTYKMSDFRFDHHNLLSPPHPTPNIFGLLTTLPPTQSVLSITEQNRISTEFKNSQFA